MMRTSCFARQPLVVLCAAVGAVCGLAAPTSAGMFSGTFQGTFVKPALSGEWLDVNGVTQYSDNSTTAVYSGVGTSQLQWGDGPFAVPHSLVAFTGYTISNAPGNTEIAIGEFSYTNGSSLLASLIFGSELDIQLEGEPSVQTLVIQMEAISTTNRGIASYDADFLSFDLLHNTFHVYEGETAKAVLYARIIGDPTLEPTRIGDVSGGGFLGTGPIPEPTSLTLIAIGGICCAVFAHRRGRRRPTT